MKKENNLKKKVSLALLSLLLFFALAAFSYYKAYAQTSQSNCAVVKVGTPTVSPSLPASCSQTSSESLGTVSPVSPRAVQYSWAEAIKVFGDPGAPPTQCEGCADTTSNTQWVPNNIVSISFFGHQVKMHKKVAPYLEAAEKEIKSSPDSSVSGYEAYDVSSNWCYRQTSFSGRCGGNASNHAFGAAIDINPEVNQQCVLGAYDIPPGFVSIMKKWGFAWGGDWKNTNGGCVDYMHFQWQGEQI